MKLVLLLFLLLSTQAFAAKNGFLVFSQPECGILKVTGRAFNQPVNATMDFQTPGRVGLDYQHKQNKLLLSRIAYTFLKMMYRNKHDQLNGKPPLTMSQYLKLIEVRFKFAGQVKTCKYNLTNYTKDNQEISNIYL